MNKIPVQIREDLIDPWKGIVRQTTLYSDGTKEEKVFKKYPGLAYENLHLKGETLQ